MRGCFVHKLFIWDLGSWPLYRGGLYSGVAVKRGSTVPMWCVMYLPPLPSCRYEGSSGTPTLTHTEERPVAMDYLSCHRWVYTAPQTTPTLLTALLRYPPAVCACVLYPLSYKLYRRRLKEGFLLSSSRNGVVSLIAQLTVKVQTCSTCILLYICIYTATLLQSSACTSTAVRYISI